MNRLENILAEVNGATFIGLDTQTPVTLLGGKKNPLQGHVTKSTVGSNVVIFQNKKTNGYENMIKRRLQQEGKDPSSFVLSPRKWGRRLPNTPFVEHNEQLYLEVIFLKSGKSDYYVDGNQTDPSAIEGLREQEEGDQGGLENKVIIRTYNVSNITAITVNKVRHIL